MPTDKELMQQALEALESEHPEIQLRAAIALRERLAQPEQEPVAWRHKDAGRFTVNTFVSKFPEWEPLYTAPTPRKPLTKDEIRDGGRKTDPVGEDLCHWSFERGVRFAEAAHGIKGEA